MNAIHKAGKVGVVINCGTSQIKSLPPLIDRLKGKLGQETAFVVAYGPQVLGRPPDYFPKGTIFLPIPCRQGQGVMHGFDRLASPAISAEKLIYTDSEHIRFILPKIMELSLRIGENMALARWHQDVPLYAPYSQVIAETAISYTIDYTSPLYPKGGIPPSWENRKKFEETARGDSRAYGVHFLGLAGIPSAAWEKMSKLIPQLYSKSMEDFKWAGIDAGLVLAAQWVGLGLDSSLELMKQYGHEHYPRGSDGERKYAQSRVSHFRMETNVALEFLRKVNQEKVQPLMAFVEEMAGIIGAAGFHWPDREVLRGKTKPGGKSSFMKD